MESVTGDTYARLPMGPVPDHCESVVARMVEGGLLETGATLTAVVPGDRKRHMPSSLLCATLAATSATKCAARFTSACFSS